MNICYKFKSLRITIILFLIFLAGSSFSVFADEEIEKRIIEGENQLNNNNFTEALDLFDEVLSKEPENLKAQYDKAKVLYYFQKHDESLKILDNILGNEPNDKNALYLKSLILFEKRNLDEAFIVINSLLLSYPDYRPAITTKCSLLSEMNRSIEAAQCVKSLK